MNAPVSPSAAGLSPRNPEAVADATSFVRFERVRKSYDGVNFVVDDLNLAVRRGEFLTMLGPSGSGKTTSLMMLGGFEEPTFGRIFLDGEPVERLPPEKRNIGFVFQNYALFPHMTVAENVAFPLRYRGIKGAAAAEKVAKALGMVHLGPFAERKPSRMSGGQQQRVALARALVFDPTLVLMDEPLGALDKQLREHMQVEIKQLQRMLGITVVYVTHDQSEALTMSDRIAVFSDGRIQQLAAPEILYEAPANRFVAGFIGENNLLSATVTGREGGTAVVTLDGGATLRVPDPAGRAAGIATFGKRPYLADWSRIDADVAVLGAPYDFGTQWRPGARFGPRAIRDASTLFSFGHAGAYDHEDDVTYLEGVRIVDLGDADIIHTDTVGSHANIESAVRRILDAGALPVVLGGDHSINIPCIAAYGGRGPIHVVQIDAHLDFVDERHGVRLGHGSPMRRAAERPWVSGLTQIGIRNVSSTAREGYAAARAYGSDIVSVREARRLGIAALAGRVPPGARLYLTIDIDGFDPSIAPGTGTPSHGGFLYYEVLELFEALCTGHHIVGVDLVEVAPDYDHGGTTAILAAQVLLNLIGRIFHHRTLSQGRAGE